MYDIAVDHKTGDWVFAANADFQGVSGDQVVEQRILTRLRIIRGWELDPTNGALGSSLRNDLRLQRGRARRELPLAVREALTPMDDVRVQEVVVTDDEDDLGALRLRIEYQIIDPFNEVSVERQSNALVLEIGA